MVQTPPWSRIRSARKPPSSSSLGLSICQLSVSAIFRFTQSEYTKGIPIVGDGQSVVACPSANLMLYVIKFLDYKFMQFIAALRVAVDS